MMHEREVQLDCPLVTPIPRPDPGCLAELN
jgi:hypothetical protein